MDKFKGTPAPWVNVGGWVDAEKRSDDLSGIICSISAVAARNPEEINNANANLIAAAPELLEALQHVLSAWVDEDMADMTDAEEESLIKARAAISKALGN